MARRVTQYELPLRGKNRNRSPRSLSALQREMALACCVVDPKDLRSPPPERLFSKGIVNFAPTTEKEPNVGRGQALPGLARGPQSFGRGSARTTERKRHRWGDFSEPAATFPRSTLPPHILSPCGRPFPRQLRVPSVRYRFATSENTGPRGDGTPTRSPSLRGPSCILV